MKKCMQLLGLATACVLASMGVALAHSPDHYSHTTEKVYVVATDGEYVPFEFSVQGKLVGFDVDLVNAIAKEEGFKVKYEIMSFDGIIPALQTGAIDVGMAGISITPPRAKVVDFSSPYLAAGLAIMTKKANANLDSIEKLKGVPVGTQLGTVAVDYLKRQLPDGHVTLYQNVNNIYLDLNVGRIKAVVFDAPSLAYYVQSEAKDNVVTAYLTSDDHYGFAFTKGSKLRALFNEGLAKLKANGQYQAIVQKWFGGLQQPGSKAHPQP